MGRFLWCPCTREEVILKMAEPKGTTGDWYTILDLDGIDGVLNGERVMLCRFTPDEQLAIVYSEAHAREFAIPFRRRIRCLDFDSRSKRRSL